MDIEDAEKRLQRFVPAIKELFPETNDGIIESSHTELKHAEELKGITLESFSGPVYAKLDNYLPISGSVKPAVAYTRYCGLLSRWLYRRAL